MSLITIDQLLESVDLDFDSRWVTKDSDTEDGLICAWNAKPTKRTTSWQRTDYTKDKFVILANNLKLAEFADKDWQECIYEVPRESTGKIEKIEVGYNNSLKAKDWQDIAHAVANKINELVDAVNELKGAKNE